MNSAAGTPNAIVVSAVAMRDDQGRLLTVRKRGTDNFIQPGGKPEAGETDHQAAVREVKEEIGLDLNPDKLRLVGIYTQDAANEAGCVIEAHLFEYTQPVNSYVQIAAEIEEMRWLDFSEGRTLPDDLAPLIRNVVLPMYGRRVVKTIAVYTGARLGTRPEFISLAVSLGKALADAGVTLVYGGGKAGLMGAVADACLDAGGSAIGVIPRDLVDRELAHESLTHLEVVHTMHERKARMVELADGFIALPGGAGTLDELMEAWTWQQLGIHSKPIALVDGEYWAPLMDMLHHMVEAGLVREADRDALLVIDDPVEVVSRFNYWTPPRPKWR
ncbi:TIGR00730 family Rossman fold protein [Corynebacterium sp. 4HC-13]|uniref:TIGR00730 family Rossman fold protein n=2 Tax=Corynebacterium anserum TaxID=2684406 RepID=A0A7G7YQY3_9CORY|nr:TIGR00730 family Rossman fold protein [Corynebacterium anserum]QNH96903.1 TIGR00730 family Rossman fold protein [Corynebacterium anserum]